MIKFILRALIAAFGLWLAAQVVPGVEVHSIKTLIFAAVLLGLVNAIVRPILFILTLPITIVTLGLFILVINGLMVLLVAHFLHRFHVHGLIPAIETSIIVTITGWIGSAFLSGAEDRK